MILSTLFELNKGAFGLSNNVKMKRFREPYLTPNKKFNDEDELKNMNNATLVTTSPSRLLSTIACI